MRQLVLSRADSTQSVVFLVSPSDLAKAKSLRARVAPEARIVVHQAPEEDHEVTELYEYLPENLHQEIAAICDPLLGRWEDLLGIGAPLPADLRVSQSGSNHLLTLRVEARVKKLCCVRAILERERPDVIWHSREYDSYLIACGVVNGGVGQRISRAWKRGMLVWFLGAFSLLYQFVYKWARAAWRDRGKRPLAPRVGQTLCIGEESLLYNLSDEICEAMRNGADPVVLITMDRRGQRRRQLPSALKAHARYADTLGNLRDRLVAAAASCRFYRDIARSVFGALPNLSAPEEGVWRLIEWDVIRYTVITFPTVMLHSRLVPAIFSACAPKKVFVANPANWGFELFRLEARRRGIETASYTHGMVESALAYRSRTDYFYVCGGFDRDLLAAYNPPSRILAVGPALIRNLSVSRRSAGKAVLLTSCIGAAGLHKRLTFLSETLEFLSSNPQADAGQITIKLHPFERHGSVRRDIEALHRRFHSLADRMIVQSDDLSGALEGAAVAFLMPSTTLMDCLRLDIPFFLFDTADFDRNTFYGRLPAVARYGSAAELRSQYAERIGDPGLNAAISAAYYGPQTDWDAGRRHLQKHFGAQSLVHESR